MWSQNRLLILCSNLKKCSIIIFSLFPYLFIYLFIPFCCQNPFQVISNPSIDFCRLWNKSPRVPGQRGLVVGDPAHGRGVETRWSLWSFSTQAILFYATLEQSMDKVLALLNLIAKFLLYWAGPEENNSNPIGVNEKFVNCCQFFKKQCKMT